MTGFTSAQASAAAGITYRQLDHWARTGLVVPTGGGHGTGDRRRYSERDVTLLAVVKRLLEFGLTLDTIRGLVDMREVNVRLTEGEVA